MTDSGFTVDVDQNQYLPEDGREVSAVVTVTSGADVAVTAPGGGAGSAEIIIIDCSGSMDYPPTKMTQARAAPAAAIDVVRDDALATAMRPSGGKTGQAVLVPATTANPTPSRTTSIAAAVAARAWVILVGG